MITEEALSKLHNELSNKVEITTSELSSLGFNSKDIKKLIEQSYIERITRGKYKYLKKDFPKEEPTKNKPIKKISKKESLLNLLYEILYDEKYNGKYADALEIVDELYKSNYLNQANYNYIILLFSYITPLKEKHRLISSSLKIEDIMPVEDDKIFVIPNLARKNTYTKCQYPAEMTYRSFILENNIDNIESKILTRLYKIVRLNNQSKSRRIKSLIALRNYEELINFIEKITFQNYKVKYEQTLITASRKYIEIKTTKTIPPIINSDSKSYEEAIENNDFYLAMDLAKDHLKNHNYSSNKISNVIDILEDIIILIKNLKNSKTKTIKEPSIKPEIPQIISKKNPVNPTPVLSSLLKNDLDSALTNLRNILNETDKKEYEFLIIDFIKISIIEGDLTYSKPILILTKLLNNNYSYNINDYIEQFYLAISLNNSKLASLYLDIITNLNTLNNEGILIESLNEVLNLIEKNEETPKEIPSIDNSSLIDESPITKDIEEDDDSYENETYEDDEEKYEQLEDAEEEYEGLEEEPEEYIEPEEEPEEDLNPEDDLELEEDISYEEQAYEEEQDLQKKREYDKNNHDYIATKHHELIEKRGIVVLDPMSDERIQDLIYIVDEYDDMSCFLVKDKPYNKLVLKEKVPKNKKETLDIKAIYKEMTDNYNKFKYSESIENGFTIIANVKTPYAAVYAFIGLSFLKLKKLKIAIPYLRIATYISQNYENGNFDFRNFTDKKRTGRKFEKVENKPIVKVNEDEFNVQESDNYYNFKRFAKINDYINENGIGIDEATEYFSLTEEEHDLLLLIYARLFYIEGSYEYGDRLIKEYVKSEHKTQKTISIWKDIEARKKFLINNYQNELPLSLKLLKN